MAIAVEYIGQRATAPRWAVLSWMVALHCAVRRRDNAELYLTELLGLALDRTGWAVA